MSPSGGSLYAARSTPTRPRQNLCRRRLTLECRAHPPWAGTHRYPLRPEFAESLLLMFQATHDERWRNIAVQLVDMLERVYAPPRWRRRPLVARHSSHARKCGCGAGHCCAG